MLLHGGVYLIGVLTVLTLIFCLDYRLFIFLNNLVLVGAICELVDKVELVTIELTQTTYAGSPLRILVHTRVFVVSGQTLFTWLAKTVQNLFLPSFWVSKRVL